jgi:hypothetical protein
VLQHQVGLTAQQAEAAAVLDPGRSGLRVARRRRRAHGEPDLAERRAGLVGALPPPGDGTAPVVAAAALPLQLAGHTLGAVELAFSTAREFPADERGYATTLVGLAAQTLQRAIDADRQRSIAATLQQSLLPSALPEHHRLALAARYLPAAEVEAGGDWYDVLLLDDDRIAFAVGDVVGHGAAAAATMGQLRAALSAYLLDGASPARALAQLDRFSAPRSRGAGQQRELRRARRRRGQADVGVRRAPTAVARRRRRGRASRTACTGPCSACATHRRCPSRTSWSRRATACCSTPTGSSNAGASSSTTACTASRRPRTSRAAGRWPRCSRR